MSAGAPIRIVRAGVFTAACVALTCLAHAAFSQTEMSAGPVLAVAAPLLVAAYALGGHERSLPTILGLLVFGQFAMHVLFSRSGGHHLASRAEAVQNDGWGMTAAHLGVAVVCAWWLRRGERAAWRIAALLSAAVCRFLVVVLAVPAPDHRGTVQHRDLRPAPRSALLEHSLALRGPPAAAPAHA